MARKVESYERGFKEFTQLLCSSGLVVEAYLVGSRARGDSIPSSDFDVVVVVEDDVDILDVAVKLRLLKKTSIPLDVIVLRRSDLEDPVYREMLRDAERICGSATPVDVVPSV
jgi:predicted nucleotidyltransferase